MGQKNFKGTVSISNAEGRIRLRWRYLTKRYSLSLYKHSKQNLLLARKTALEIEQDMVKNEFDFTLRKYKIELDIPKSISKSVVALFEEWVSSYRQLNCDVQNPITEISLFLFWGYCAIRSNLTIVNRLKLITLRNLFLRAVIAIKLLTAAQIIPPLYIYALYVD